ncbi:hypothetical protein [Streptomyces chartreusis]|uniref:hypothetical protein n=1 Tax=Streptomyces chartreusis TaxID=1969 RepID=UPI0036BEAD11
MEELGGDFQFIVLEHADLDDDPFRNAIHARWWRSNGEALTSENWISYDRRELTCGC